MLNIKLKIPGKVKTERGMYFKKKKGKLECWINCTADTVYNLQSDNVHVSQTQC